ncbi:MAG: DUF4149 domain-containing protein [Nitrospira sp.]|nr:DUF4149 domain-containing protein [Nitrospira sp.]MEB2338117.1 DUF4149 domain-containing protein [Nitrospirales bacterium]
MEGPLTYLHTLAIGTLIGKVVCLSFVVAPVLAKTLEPESFGKVVRKLFPAYYLLGMLATGMGLLSWVIIGLVTGVSPLYWAVGLTWLCLLAAEDYCLSPLTPRSNEMRDRLKEQERQGAVDAQLSAAWTRLHQRSLYLNALVLFGGLGLLLMSLHL